MIRPFTLAVLLAAALTSPAAFSLADATQDKAASPTAEHPQRWPASKNLRGTMTEVAGVLRSARAAMPDNQPTAAQLEAIADRLESLIAGISVGDTTSKRAQKALALIIGEFGDSVDLMRNASHLAARRLGYLMAVRTANNYGKEFDHAGWELLSEK